MTAALYIWLRKRTTSTATAKADVATPETTTPSVHDGNNGAPPLRVIVGG